MVLFLNRKMWIGVGIIVLIIAGFFVWKFWIYEEPFVAMNEKDFTSGEQYMDYLARLEKEYAKDNYGGATPEETLQLFISALKAGDTELAAKYFVVEKQDEYIIAINNWKKNNAITNIVETINSFEEIKFPLENTAQVVIKKDGVVFMLVPLIKNTFSNKWKIESL